jgi:glucosamine--fructose-6-phosphate aminotransferase (isomerizing)
MKLKRCGRCLLPETMPFITYDQKGVCNYCKSYKKKSLLGIEKLNIDLQSIRKIKDRPNCIVAFSGGRDSSYSLHYIKEVLQLNPLAFSYDWGMLTDLGRRNQSRMTSRLGVEHILVSADIQKKRKYIHQNVLAWLKKPHLGTIPLFMAGDKQYFYFANKVKQENQIDKVIMGENYYEKTIFKNGFAGIKQTKTGFMAYDVPSIYKLKMLFFYAGQFLNNPSYLNGSLVDSTSAFLSYFMIPHDYINLFDYIKWNEEEVNSVLDIYNWERATDTDTTWRIGDGTAAFYNFIYFTVAGFTELDTFLSNQIREGDISREIALEKLTRYNFPRLNSIEWYCQTIDIDFEESIRKIITIPKLYNHLL